MTERNHQTYSSSQARMIEARVRRLPDAGADHLQGLEMSVHLEGNLHPSRLVSHLEIDRENVR